MAEAAGVAIEGEGLVSPTHCRGPGRFGSNGKPMVCARRCGGTGSLAWPPRSWPSAQTLVRAEAVDPRLDRKSTRLNSSHTVISYAVFCLKKKTYERRDHIQVQHMT